MKKLIFAVILISVTAQFLYAADEKSSLSDAHKQHEARMKWWHDARFGMFVHWGLYSGLAGDWKGKMVSDHGGLEWIQKRVGADTWEYAHEAVPHFKPSKDFAQQWAAMAKEAGCRYVVFTSKHHDGFCLHDSDVTTYDAKDITGRDLCKEIVDACRGEGLRIGMYHSVIDWHHPQYDYKAARGLPHPLRGKPSPNGPRNNQIYVDYLHRQVEELMSNYGKIDVVWWDFSSTVAQGPFWRSDELMEMVRKHQPDIVSNNRLYRITSQKNSGTSKWLKQWQLKQGDFTTPEQHIPDTGVPGVSWEVCMTMNTTWGYNKHDHAWKPSEQLIRNLVDIVSKGGNYLLNIGPKGDGSIPEESIERMKTIGRWMDVNGEAIYGTTASPFVKPAWGRYTQKPGRLYVHVFDWPKDGKLTIPAKKAARAYLLADKEKPLAIQQTADGITLQLPEKAPDPIVSVIAVELQE
jgi:alpha-L-fucosidase